MRRLYPWLTALTLSLAATACTGDVDDASEFAVLGADAFSRPGVSIDCARLGDALGVTPLLSAEAATECRVRDRPELELTGWALFEGVRIEMQRRGVAVYRGASPPYVPPDRLDDLQENDVVSTSIRDGQLVILSWNPSQTPEVSVQWSESLGEDERVDFYVWFDEAGPRSAIERLDSLNR